MFQQTEGSQFTGFGRSARIGRCRSRLARMSLGKTARDTRRALRVHCPHRPGVYGMISPDGELLYVGKAKSLRNRLLSYFLAGAEAQKAGRIVDAAATLVWERTSNEFAALMRELELIRRFRPRYNVAGQPGRLRRGYLCVGRSPAAYVYLSPTVSAPVDRAYGPVLIGRRMRRAVDRLNAVFQLRDCPDRVPMLFADQQRLFDLLPGPQCLRHELGACLGPCAGLCTSGNYGQAVRATMALVEGLDNAMLEQLETSMRQAAAGQHFERAAVIRDTCDDLRYVQQQVAHITDVRRRWTFIYAPPARGVRRTWHFIRGGLPIGAVQAPRDAQHAAHCLARLIDQFPDEPRVGDSDERDALPFVLLTSRWFRMNPQEFEYIVPIDRAMQVCREMTK